MEGFDAKYWLSQKEEKPAEHKAPQPASTPVSGENDFEKVARQIEERGIDITSGYVNWRNLAYAIADGLGETGRDIYHRICKYNPEYEYNECDRQYTACLNGHGEGITKATFFQLAKEHGINISTSSSKLRNSVKTGAAVSSEDKPEAKLPDYLPAPSFSQDICDSLPDFLKKVACKADNEKEADILILGTIACISAVLPNYSGVYDEVTIYANLCYYLTAYASSGKGRQGLCRLIVKPIHDELLEERKRLQEQYEMDMLQYDRDKHDKKKTGILKPRKPAQKMLILPGDTSATAVIQIMHDNDGTALIFETEGDTLATSFKSDYANYSTNFRNAFHHEPFGFHRRGDDEHVEVDVPKLSTVLSGTPDQIKTLIKTPENGLFSRFAFYYLESNLEFKNVFKRTSGESLNKYFASLGQEYLEFYHELQKAHPLEFSLTPQQEEKFLDYFSESQTELFIDFGEGILATIRRMGIICYRLAMILTALRIMETGDFYSNPVCADQDFDSALKISSVLLQHSTKVFCELFGEKQRPRLSSVDEKRLYNALPTEFGRPDYIKAARELKINERTAEGYVSKFCGKMGLVERLGYGKYRKKE